jgi:3-oxocholest-4-en-26-oyl-CoA dehydrogenase alpha subunit
VRLVLTDAQVDFRAEVHDYFTRVVTPEVRAEVERDDAAGAAAYRDLMRRIGGDGWLCPTWPTEFGGRGLSEVEQYLFFDETQRLGVPLPFLSTTTVGPTIMRFGTPEQQATFLPAVRRGEALFAIGYSEPGAGTDLASLTTRAEREGDEYVITGQKMWTSLVHRADHVWLACRTDPDAPKHRGISVVIVPTDAEGFSWTKVDTIGGGLTSATFYDRVRVPVTARVGPEHGGWQLLTNQLNAERVALACAGPLERRLTLVRRWAQETKTPDGARVIDQTHVQHALARVHAELEVLRLMNYRVAWGAAQDRLAPADASVMKVYGSELSLRAYRALADVVGHESLRTRSAPGAVIGAELEDELRRALIVTFGGGTNEVQRDIIATLGLGLPRPSR